MTLVPEVKPAPREIPVSTKIVVLCGGVPAAFGWLFFGFGMIFVWLFGDKTDYSSVFVMRGTLETVPGLVISVDKTSFSEGGGKHRPGTPVYEYQYTFTAVQAPSRGISYSTGQRANVGANVTVEFPPGRPDRSRIRGMRHAVFGPTAALVFLFPLAGLGIILASLRPGPKNVRLLTLGQTAQGTLTGKEPTNMRVNRRTVYKLIFQFSDSAGQPCQAVVRSSTPEKFETGQAEWVFYDQADPSTAKLLDCMPGPPGLSERGDILPCGVWKLLAAGLPPLVGLGIFVGGFALKINAP